MEYVEEEKGRESGFNEAFTFEAKLAQGIKCFMILFRSLIIYNTIRSRAANSIQRDIPLEQ